MKRLWQVLTVLVLLQVTCLALADEPLTSSKPTVIALAPHIVEILYEIGAGEQIIGTTDFADYPEQAKEIPVIGNYLGLQIERIIELQPSVIIAWKGGNSNTDLNKLTSLGFNVIYSQPLELADVPKDMRLFGKHTHNAEQAERIASAFEQRLAAMRYKYKTLPIQKAFYESWHQPLSTVAKGSWSHNLLGVCNIENVFADAANPYPQVSIEQLLDKDIQIIIQPYSHSLHSPHSSNKQGKYSGYDWAKWPTIPAVKHHRIIQPNADKLHRMSSRVLDELELLCESM